MSPHKKKPTAKIKAKTPSSSQKEIIYVDIEDDITSLITEVKKSSSSIVAIVLPKNTQMLQSIVNMRLLKKAATKSKKNIALVTSDKSILSLAGVAGVHVAESANSKPVIPTVTIEDVDDKEKDSVVEMSDSQNEVSEEKITEEESEHEAAGDKKEAATITAVKLKNKKFKVPDFGAFQTRLALGGGALVLLLVLWYVGFVVMPKATIAVTTNTENVPVKTDVTLDFAQDAVVDTEKNILPAKKVSTEKSDEITEQATGEKNIGEKAKGKITMSSQVCGAISTPSSVAKGTGVSSNGNTYITQEDVSFSFSSFDGSCLNFEGNTVDIVAQESGESSNLANNSNFTVSGRSDVSGVGSAKGGTTELITVVSDEDIEKVKDSLGDVARGEALQELKQELTEEGYSSLDVLFSVSEPSYKVTPKSGEETATFTVTQTVTYELSGYKTEDLESLFDTVLSQELEGRSDNKNVSDKGLESVQFESVEKNSLVASTVAVIGPSLDTDSLAEELAGKKQSEIIDRLESIEGVTNVEISYSPMWVTTTPKSAKKISIEVINQ